MLAPDEVLSSEYTLSNLASVACCPEVLQKVHNLLSIVRNNLGTVGTLATLVVGDDSSETEYQALRQLALALQIYLQTRKVAGLELGE